jgi:parallel beta-helix repeat protein
MLGHGSTRLALLVAAVTVLFQGSAIGGTAPPAALVVVSGNNQTAMPGSQLGTPLTLVVEDATGRPIQGVPVTFAVTSGGGILSTTSVLSGALGQAATTLTLGLEGANSVSGWTGSVKPVTLVAVARLVPAQHADYYVSHWATGASDANDGLAVTLVSGRHGPWLTIGKAAAAVQAGDIVHVASGTYLEDVVVGANGTAAAPIRFYPITGYMPIVRSFQVNHGSHIEIRGFNVVGPKALPSNWLDMPATVIDAPTVTIDPSVAYGSGRQALIDKKYATYVNTVNNVFNGPEYALFTAGIRVTASSYVTIADNAVSLHTIGIDLDQGSSEVTVTSNDCFHCCDGIWSYATAGTSVSDSLIASNHCHQNLSAGISASSAALRLTIENNLCEYNAIHQFVICAGSAYCTLRGNVAQHGGYYTETMQNPGSSAYNFFDVGTGNVADGNYAAYQNDPTQFDGNGFVNDSSSFPVRFVNNVAYRNSGSGITFTQTNGNTAINNTLVANGYLSTVPSNGAGLRFSATVSGNTIANNIFSGNRACGIQSNGALKSQVVDYNIHAPGVPAIHDSYDLGTDVYETTLDVSRATSQEAHGQSVAPSFMSAADFHLASGSPAIGAADPVRAPAADNAGLPRPSPPSTGAFDHH